jgi:phosphonate transport system ATP-binding protein
MDALQRINKHFGITVICNLHSLETARTYCDRLVGMAAGEVIFDGATATLTDAAARDLYGTATGSGAALPPADAVAPIGAFGQPAE